eukprot:3659234-Rhodomonas_salina.1
MSCRALLLPRQCPRRPLAAPAQPRRRRAAPAKVCLLAAAVSRHAAAHACSLVRYWRKPPLLPQEAHISTLHTPTTHFATGTH